MLKIFTSKQIKFYYNNCEKKLININKSSNHNYSILTIQTNIQKYLYLNLSLNNINYNSQTLDYTSINSFNYSNKKYNDTNNKLRESIIGAIINDKVPYNYFKYSKQWTNLKYNIQTYINQLLPTSTNITHISCLHKGGRKFNYDFEIKINDTIYNIELKFNAKNVVDTPQFVSLMKPSQYLSSSFEDYYYDNYLPLLANIGNLTIPNKEIYLKEIHTTTPKCLNEFQNKYYKGCKNSSKFTNNHDDIQFYNEANRISKISITKFIEDNELNINLLSKHLKKTQVSKHYMLYKNNMFHHQTTNINNYNLVSYEKQPKKYRFIVKSNTGQTISVLLRWKNGNGIAFPAFQIS